MTKNLFLLMAAAALLSSCGNKQDASCVNIGKSNAKLDSDLMTPEVLWQMGRVSDIQVSPDGQEVLLSLIHI